MWMLLPDRPIRFHVRLGGFLRVFVRLVRVGVDNGGAGIQAPDNFSGLFARRLRDERVLGFGGSPGDRTLEYNRDILDGFFRSRRCDAYRRTDC